MERRSFLRFLTAAGAAGTLPAQIAKAYDELEISKVEELDPARDLCVLRCDRRLSRKAVEALQETWERAWKGATSPRLIVLEEGMELEIKRQMPMAYKKGGAITRRAARAMRGAVPQL